MYGYLIDKHDQRIVGILETKEFFDTTPDCIKKDYDVLTPDKVYDASDSDERKIEKLFGKAGQHLDFWREDDKYIIDVEGDWKHDHLFCDDLMGSLGFKCEDESLLEESDSDWYSARHTYSRD